MAVTSAGRFTGYASLFDVADQGGDIVMPNAFAASLAKRGSGGVKMLYQHDPGELIGRWLEIAEDARGLKVTGELASGVAKAREVAALMEAGILDGLSIGFRTLRARRDTRSGLRRLYEIDLWEISLVTFPMQEAARVSSLKSATANTRLRHAARLLRFETITHG